MVQPEPVLSQELVNWQMGVFLLCHSLEVTWGPIPLL